MPMDSHNRQSESSVPFGTFWMLFSMILAVGAVLIGLPALIIGVLVQRLGSRFLHWRVSFLLWTLLLLPCLIFGPAFYQQYLEQLIQKELVAYILAAKAHRTDLLLWNWRQLWALTRPTWLQSWLLIPFVGFWREISTNAQRSKNLKTTLLQEKHKRERRFERSKQQSRTRTRRPERLPDAVGGMMVIGVPITEQEQE